MNSYTLLAVLFTGCAMWTQLIRSRRTGVGWLAVPMWLCGVAFVIAALAGAQDVLSMRTEAPTLGLSDGAEALRKGTLVLHAAWIALLAVGTYNAGAPHKDRG